MFEYQQMVTLLTSQGIPFWERTTDDLKVIEIGESELKYKEGRFVEVGTTSGAYRNEKRVSK